MYYEYFGLKQPPFRITPDTRLFYPGGNRGAVLEALVYAIGNGEGIVKVVGEVGSGKTMLCRMLEQELPKHVEIVYLANPSLSPDVILHAIAHELKLPLAAGTPRIQVMNALQEYLLRRHGEGRQVVVFVEEAQGMPLETLEEVRLLSNLETASSKLLQIVLFGQPELDEHMSRREIRQLRERVTYSFNLGPFSKENIAEYLNSRVRACGYRSGELFSTAAIRAIRNFSDGLVRRVNILADKSLLAAYADNSHTVEARHVRRAARDSEFVTRTAIFRNPIVGGILALFLIAGVGFGAWTFRPDGRSEAPDVEPSAIRSGARDGAADSVPANREPPAATVLEPAPAAVETPRTASVAQPESVNTETPPTAEVGSEPVEVEPLPEMENPATENNEAAIAPAPDAGPGIMASSPDPVSAVSGDADSAAPAAPDPLGNAAASASPVENPNQLLGMGAVFMLQDLGDARLTTSELAVLQQQLRDLPPEAAEQDSFLTESDGCRLCWSIIYRPLPLSESL